MPSRVYKLIKEREVKWVDLRFTDTNGQGAACHHPGQEVDRQTSSTDGKMFDGSSIRLERHQRLRHDPDARRQHRGARPLHRRVTLILRCDVIEPTTMQGYDRDPRSIAARRRVSEIDRTRRHRVLWPGARILRLRRREVEIRHQWLDVQHSGQRSGLVEPPGGRGRQHRPPSRRQGRLLPGAAGRLARRICAAPCAPPWSRWGSKSRCTTMKWPPLARTRSASSSTRW
jgi:hypothetical protein